MGLMYKKDNSKKCKHVNLTWSLPHARALITKYIKEGKTKEVGKTH